MSSKWEDFIDNLKDESGKLAKDELKDLVKNTKEDSEQFIKRQGEKLELYLNQLASREITKEQFEGYILDIKDLTELKAIEMLADAKARAQRLVNGIIDLIINGLVFLL
ncbi:MAG: hypothetical protein GTO17_03230 [Candidatus Aminicenantes bacterium]|nr:hypothetical protein [Candidatus Aminicenantes bacterium]